MSVTYRLFKLPSKAESSTQAIYNGEVEGYEQELVFDHKNVFKVIFISFHILSTLFVSVTWKNFVELQIGVF